ncbi:NUDIX domain-containing protein [Polaribacter sp.]|nr:NUDIX domain-containing protein [Polaribacter sp.]
MYEVFVNETPLIITSSTKKKVGFASYLYHNVVFEEVIQELNDKKCTGIILLSENLEKDWGDFTRNFEIIVAGGGLVLNKSDEILFIYRNEKWDLPKGKVEENELIEAAAIREVEEECGIENLILKEKIITTYHTYFFKGLKLKETHWYLMQSDYKGNLTPQLEEGITDVVFKNELEISKALTNTYKNIQLVYDTYRKM